MEVFVMLYYAGDNDKKNIYILFITDAYFNVQIVVLLTVESLYEELIHTMGQWHKMSSENSLERNTMNKLCMDLKKYFEPK